jgi:hypothetical protein
MYNTGKVITGLGIFLVIVTFPIWFAIAGNKTAAMPELQKAVKGTNCIIDSTLMKETHMFLLDQWRDQAVRKDQRYYTALDGTVYEKSLTRTCLNCHADKSAFCDRCHTYMAVSPYCWKCHVDPREVR